MSVAIRRAGTNDAAALALLRYRFRAARAGEMEPEAAFVQRCTHWMETHLEEDAWRCWIAERAGEIVGHVWLQLVEKIPNPSDEPELLAYITNAFVVESERNSGIGRRLLDEAVQFAQSRAVHAVILWATQGSRTLYSRVGFHESERIMELELWRHT